MPLVWREACRMEMGEAEIAFLAHMRELAKRGAAATKKLVASRPGYYSALGRRGGRASAASRRARIAAELDGTAINESTIVEAVPALPETPQPAPRPPMSLYKKLLAERGRPNLNAPPARNPWDDFAEEQREADRGSESGRFSKMYKAVLRTQDKNKALERQQKRVLGPK
jgi:hypothetical protein